jgi:hypothetical protein
VLDIYAQTLQHTDFVAPDNRAAGHSGSPRSYGNVDWPSFRAIAFTGHGAAAPQV